MTSVIMMKIKVQCVYYSKAEVVSIFDDIAECPECASVMKTAKCDTASTVKVILDCDGDRVVSHNVLNKCN